MSGGWSTTPPRADETPSRPRAPWWWALAGVVLLVVGLLVWQPWDGAESVASPTDSPTPTPTAPAGPVECSPADITVEALTDKGEYGQGENPQLSIRLTNTSANACTMNVGTSAQSFTVTSGSDVWWRSTDCQSEPSDMEVTLAAGQQVTSAAPLTWDRTRSSVSSCGGERPFAPGGGATYHLSVSIGGIPSSGTVSFILR